MFLRAFRPVLALALPVLAGAQSSEFPPCEAPSEIRAAIRAAGKVEQEKDGQRRPMEEVRKERQERFKALAAAHPDNFWVLRAYIDGVKGGPVASDELVSEFKKRYDAAPDDPAATFLFAHSLMGKDTPKTISLMTELTEKMPGFPAPWLALANIHGYPNFNDRAKMAKYAESYLGRCPESNEAAHLASRLEKSARIEAFAQSLRQRIAGKADEETVGLYRALWTIEFKVTPLPEQAPLRKRVEEDLQFLAGLDKDKFPVLNYVLQEGYKLTGNKEAQEKLAAEAKTASEKLNAFFQAQQEWYKANPYPTPGAEPEKRQDFFKKRLAFLEEWISKSPGDEFILLDRLRALSEISETPDSSIVEEGEKVLEASRKKNSMVMMSSSAPMQVADVWAKRGIKLDRVPAMVQEGVEALDEQRQRQREMQESDLFASPDRRLMEESNRWYTDTSVWRTLVTAYAKMGKSKEARDILTQWETGLAERRKRAEEIRKKRDAEKTEAAPAARPTPGPDRNRMAEDSIVRGMPHAESQYFDALAQLALAEKRKLDALTFYQSGVRAMASPDPAKSEIGRKAIDLWRELGGTQEGWQTWLDSLRSGSGSKLPDQTRWSAMNRPLPEFSLLDQGGKTWTVANVKGKTTLLNVWATWCGPCREELPHLQKLHDKVKDREDVQIITLNVDENTGLIEPFLTENKYTFPVLVAKAFIDAFTGPLGIPTNWISDRAGAIRQESLGFGGDGEEWLKQTLDQIEKVREEK